MRSNEFKSQLQLHFVVFVWGITASLGELITLPATQLVWHRMLIAAASLYLWTRIKKIDLTAEWIPALKMIGTGAITAAHWIAFFHAIKISNVSITLACLSSSALFASLLEPLIFRRPVNFSEILFGLLTIFGILVIFEVTTGHEWGIITALISALLATTFAVINGIFARFHHPAVITTYEMIGGVIAVSLYLALTGGFTKQMFDPPLMDWAWLFLLGTLCTAYAFIVSVQVMKFLNPYTVVLTINLEPVYGIMGAYLIFGDAEKMNLSFYLGTLLILAAVFGNALMRRFFRRRQANQYH